LRASGRVPPLFLHFLLDDFSGGFAAILTSFLYYSISGCPVFIEAAK